MCIKCITWSLAIDVLRNTCHKLLIHCDQFLRKKQTTWLQKNKTVETTTLFFLLHKKIIYSSLCAWSIVTKKII